MAGKFTDVLPDSQGAHPGAHVHVGTVSGHAPSDAIIIPDAHLLFGGDYKRSGVDLILSGDDHREVVLHDYFKGEKRAALASPDGAHLTGDIINALTGHTQFAQADGSASTAQVIGHVTKLAGTATAIRNGVSIILNQGDNVNKGDVVASGSDSTLGITFIDGTVFGLASNAKMVLNEMIYDPNGSDNKSLISLVQGTISFVAGATAKHGDMKVDTPVATMGIRGTAVLVEIDFTVPASGGAPPAKFQVLVEPDGTTGSYILFDKTTLTPIATVNQAGTQTVVNGQGGVNFLSSAQLSADAQKIITDVFALKFSDLNNPNTKLTTNFTDSIVPQTFFLKLANGDSIPVDLQLLFSPDKAGTVTPGATIASREHIPGPPAIATTGGATAEHILLTGSGAVDSATGTVSYADLNPGDVPTVKTAFDSFTYQNAAHTDVSATLTAAQLAAIHAAEVPLVVVQDTAGINHGVATWTYNIADGAFDFLAAGEVLTLTYRARVDNNFAPNNETAFQTFTITIVGTNDVPVITTGVPQIDFAGGKTTPGGVLTAHVPTSGTLTFKDPDLTDHHTVAAALSTVALDGVDVGTVAPAPLSFFQTALTASLAADSTNSGTGTINWSLADFPVYFADFIPFGKTLTLTYTVTVTDSQGAVSTQQVVVTITGTDTPAVVWIATAHPGQPAGGLWSDGANWETGTVPTADDDAIIITNQLIGLTPSFPVTINQAAVAKTVTMNDFGTTAPVVINNSTLTVGDSFSMSSDSVLQNFGTVNVGGLMEVLDHSSLQNSGTLKLAGGGDFKNQSSITNAATGKIEISGGTLNVLVDIANSGEVKVDSGAVLTLASGTIDGGTVTNAGTFDLEGNAALTDGTLNNTGGINVSGSNNSFGGETVSNNLAGAISITGYLTLDHASTITNVGATNAETVAAGATLTLQDTSYITGGKVTNAGTIDLNGSSALKNGKLANSGTVNAAGTTALLNEIVTNDPTGIIDVTGALTLDGTTVTGGTVTDAGTIKVNGGQTLKLSGVALSGGAITNSGTIDITGSGSINNDLLTNHQLTVDGGQTLTLNGTTVIGGIVTDTGTINIDTGETLKLNGVALSGGAITNAGTIDITGSSSIDNDHLTNYQLTVDAGQILTLNGTTVSGGTITISGELDSTGSSFIIGSSVTNGAGTIKVASGSTLELDSGTIVNGGSLVNSGTLQIETSSGATLNGVAVTGGGVINVDVPVDAATLILEGGTSITDGTLVNGDVGTVEIYGLDGATFDNVDVSNTGLLQVDGGSKLLLVGGATITGGDVTVATGGLLKTYGAGIEINAAVTNHGTIEINNGGTLKISTSISGTGSVRIDGGATFELNGSDDQTVEFHGANAVFKIDGSSFGGSIAGFAVSDEIDLKAFGYDETTTATFEKGVLTLFHGGESISMTLVGDYSHAHLAGSGDGTHTLITFKAEDDAPVFSEDSEKGSVDEQPNTTGSSAPDSVGGTLHFSDVDLLDRPTASVTSKSVTWTAADHHTDLGTPSQLAAIENALTLTQAGANNGAIGWNYSIADGVLDFLAEGETITFTATVTLTDGEKSDTAQVVVTITGHNDAPVVAAALSDSAHEGDASFSRNLLDGSSDVDHGETATLSVAHLTYAVDGGTASTTLPAGITLGADGHTLTVDPTDPAFNHLAVGEQTVITVSYDVKDAQGATVAQTEAITIKGTNDAPVVAAALSNGAHEGDASFSRNLLDGASDADHGETATLSVVHLTYAVDGGTASTTLPHGVSLGADGHTLTVDPTDPAFDYLQAGEKTVITVSYDVKDAQGATVAQTETITITGTNDAPYIVAEADPQAEAVMVVPATAMAVLAPGVTTNSLGLKTETFNDLSVGQKSFHSTALDADFSGSGSAAVFHGSVDGVAAAPFFGPLPGAPDTTNYFSVGGGGTETITFGSEQNAFGLYWGSVDSYNTISFYDGMKLVASYSGANVSPLFSDGNQGSFASNGYVQFSGLAQFNKVVLQSSSNAFEVDNISSGAIHSKLSASVSGTLSAHDADIGDTLTAFVTGNGTVQFTGANGSHQLPAGANVAPLIDANDVTFDSVQSDGGTDVLHWTYHPTNPNLDFLKAGDVLKVQFAAEVSDGHGHTESQPLTVTLVGANSATDTSAFGVVNGTTAGDTFNHVGGNVTIFGNAGPDTFVFKPGFGSATIADFDVNNDAIEISKDLFKTFADVIANAHPVNANLDLAITDAASETITLKGVTASQLHASNFHLV